MVLSMKFYWTSSLPGARLKQISSILWIIFVGPALALLICLPALSQDPAAKQKSPAGSQPSGPRHKPAADSRTVTRVAPSTATKDTAAGSALSVGKRDHPSSGKKSPDNAPNVKKAPVSEQVESPRKDENKSAPQGHHSNHKKSSAEGRGGLVPPPPPSIPTATELGVSGVGTMIFVGENIDFLSRADLIDLQQKTDQRIERYRRDVEELVTAAAEKKQRAGSFDQLFVEGVISKRELETSKRESEKASQELADAKQTLTMLEQKHARIEQRLSILNKTKKPANKVPTKAANKASNKPADKASNKPADKSADKAADKASNKPADKASSEPADKSADKAAAESTIKNKAQKP
jgi:hypothetical protein